MEKKCKDCNENDRVGGRSYCQACYWQRFKGNHKKYLPNIRRFKQQRQDFIHRYKSFCGCVKCNEKKHYMLDLHHIDSTIKSFDMGIGTSKGFEVLKNEMRKCVVLCKNHHYEFHYLERNNNINLKDYLDETSN